MVEARGGGQGSWSGLNDRRFVCPFSVRLSRVLILYPKSGRTSPACAGLRITKLTHRRRPVSRVTSYGCVAGGACSTVW